MDDDNDDTDKDITIAFQSSDGIALKVPWKVARLSSLVQDSVPDMDDMDSDNEPEEINVPLHRVKHHVLLKVIEYCERYATDPMEDFKLPFTSLDISDIVQEWYANFVLNLTLLQSYELMDAAEYMGVKPLLRLILIPQSILLYGKDTKDLRKMFCIPVPKMNKLAQRGRRKKRVKK